MPEAASPIPMGCWYKGNPWESKPGFQTGVQWGKESSCPSQMLQAPAFTPRLNVDGTSNTGVDLAELRKTEEQTTQSGMEPIHRETRRMELDKGNLFFPFYSLPTFLLVFNLNLIKRGGWWEIRAARANHSHYSHSLFLGISPPHFPSNTGKRDGEGDGC